ncbi:UNVERIFIED_CONTAM: hypothetical protein FKN15_076174 [Acipenser sinensis]
MERVLNNVHGAACVVFLDDLMIHTATFPDALKNRRTETALGEEKFIPGRSTRCPRACCWGERHRHRPCQGSRSQGSDGPQDRHGGKLSGIVSYYRWFIKDFANTPGPCTASTRREAGSRGLHGRLW